MVFGTKATAGDGSGPDALRCVHLFPESLEQSCSERTRDVEAVSSGEVEKRFAGRGGNNVDDAGQVDNRGPVNLGKVGRGQLEQDVGDLFSQEMLLAACVNADVVSCCLDPVYLFRSNQDDRFAFLHSELDRRIVALQIRIGVRILLRGSVG